MQQPKTLKTFLKCKYDMKKPNILLIYTGGTIGMIKDPEYRSTKSFRF